MVSPVIFRETKNKAMEYLFLAGTASSLAIHGECFFRGSRRKEVCETVNRRSTFLKKWI